MWIVIFLYIVFVHSVHSNSFHGCVPNFGEGSRPFVNHLTKSVGVTFCWKMCHWYCKAVTQTSEHAEGGNLDLAREIHKISKFLSNHGTFQCWSSMSYISINFRPSVPTQLAVASSNQLKPVKSSLVHMTNRISMVCNSDLSGLKLSVNIANPCSKLLCTEMYQIFRKQTLYI